MALWAVSLILVLAFAPAGALLLEMDSLAKARAEAAHAEEALSEAVARANAARQKVSDLAGDWPFWFPRLFADPDLDAVYRKDPYIAGPTPIDDLGFLYAIIKELRPKTIVEIGFWAGDGTKAFLSAADKDATVHSFDPRPKYEADEKLKAQLPGTGKNFVFHQKSGEEITSEDIGGNKVGFAFIDAAHIAWQSFTIFEKLLPLLADDAVVAVHDTGAWGKKFLDDHKDDENVQEWWSGMKVGLDKDHPGVWPLVPHGEGDNQYYIHPNVRQERTFVNMVMDKHPEWGTINFNSLNHLNMGITLMQRQRKLDVAFP